MTRASLRTHIRSFELSALFIEDLGWDRAALGDVPVQVDDRDMRLHPIAHKRGFVTYLCNVGELPFPNREQRWRIEREVARYSLEHMIIFEDDQRSVQLWEWVRRE